MPDEFKSTDYEFQQIFGKNGRLEVPQFQRSYSWRTEQVQTLWEDLRDYWFLGSTNEVNLPEYFLGSIVTVEDESGTEILLDGQQRLATLTILASVVRDRLKAIGLEKATSVANSTQQLLIARSAAWETEEEYKLVLNREDREFFIRSVQKEPVEKRKPILLSHKLIAKARTVLEKCVDEFLNTKSDDAKFRDLQLLVKAVASAIVLIKIKVRNEDEASSIFEVLNDRGLDLGTEDLLRNYLLQKAHEGDRASVVECWNDILGHFTRGGIQSFLRHSWISRHPLVSKKYTYRGIKAAITSPDQIVSFAEQLSTDAAVYTAIASDAALPELKGPGLDEELAAFAIFRARQCMPLLLAVYEDCRSEFRRTLNRVNCVTLRYNICEKNPNQLEGRYSNLALEVRRQAGDPTLVAEAIHSALAPLVPTDLEFEKAFSELVTDRADLQRYLLGELERVIGHHSEFVVAGSQTVHVEHIYPQSPAKYWPKMEMSHNALGNLTLLAGGPNKSIGNRSFAEKRQAYSVSEIAITNKLADCERWDENEIAKRQMHFAKLATAIWPFK